ncbi:hypothetical protein DGMP_33820 [Desulfomarina profundi]|uniref:LPS export ABC transporter periplasmic protein LptC n=1 Tax=Desulfomarina profundi TaxID=2772557 RepID=A0A8D5JIH2_9BACT|nr:LPS export ABC transporter periplasmic protein LptC [Desulfomarina profundi]BCL62689.1 hypothetical protein DGMP_33820 [Desulfomarina profundi]
MKLHRNQVWLIPLLLILTYPLWSIPIGKFLTPRGGVPAQTVIKKTNQHNFRMESVKILQNQNGKKTAMIRAKSARTGDDTDILILETVDADIFDEDGNVTHIVSRTGKYNVKTKALTLSGDVVVNKIRDNQFLYTDLLHYNSDKRTVNCPGKTKLIGENVSIDGGSLDYDINSARYDIGGRVSVDLEGFSAPAPAPRS